MLTKSAAKAFFLGGTALCGVAFILLTLDTLKQLPERSRQEDMTDQVVRGHEIWNKNNCMGCHTLMGEGAYYAPELTQVLDRRGAQWIDAFLQDPESFYPGRRKMIKYDIFNSAVVGTEEAAGHRADIIAFLEWVGHIDTNGFPAAPDLVEPAVAANLSPGLMASAPVYFQGVCSGCHSVGGTGGNVGPALDGVSNRFDADYLRKWVSDPQSVKPNTTMPQLPMSDRELNDILDFLGGI